MAATFETMSMVFVAIYLIGSILHRYYLAAVLEKTKIELITLKIEKAEKEKIANTAKKEEISDGYVGLSLEREGNENQP